MEKNGDETILRVQRVTHGVENRTVVVPFSTQTVIDPNLAPGQSEIRQQGQNGEKTQIYNVTYVDGVAESETLQSENVTTMAVDQIIAIGPAKAESSTTDSGSTDNNQGNSGSNKPNDSADNSSNESSKPTDTNKPNKPENTGTTDNKNDSVRATRAIPVAIPVIPAATQAVPITLKMRTPEATIARHRLPLLIRLHRAVFGILPWLRRNPMQPAPQPSAAGPATTGLAWSNCGTVNPAGSGTRKISHPAPTAYRSRCRPAKWPHSAPTIAMMPPCKSIGLVVHRPTLRQPVRSLAAFGTNRLVLIGHKEALMSNNTSTTGHLLGAADIRRIAAEAGISPTKKNSARILLLTPALCVVSCAKRMSRPMIMSWRWVRASVH